MRIGADMTVNYPVKKAIANPSFRYTMSWHPDSGVSVEVTEHVLNWETANGFTNYVNTFLLTEMAKFEAEQQSKYFNFEDYGLEIVSGLQGKVWVPKGGSLEIFGTPYLKWNFGIGRGGYSSHNPRRNGEWNLFLNGIDENYSRLGTALWHDDALLAGLAQKASQGDILLIELTMLHPEKVRSATNLWEQSHAATMVREIVCNARRHFHTPYTKIAKILRDANVVSSSNQWQRLRVYPILLPNSNIAPAVLIKSNTSQPQQVKEVMEANGYSLVEIDWTQMLGHRSGDHAIWAKNSAVFDQGGSRFKEWVVAQVPQLTTRSRAGSALV